MIPFLSTQIHVTQLVSTYRLAPGDETTTTSTTIPASLAKIMNSSRGKVNDTAPGLTQLSDLIATIRAWGLIACILAIITAGLLWAWGSQSQNGATATQGKKGVIVAIAASALIFAAEALVTWGAQLGDIDITT